MALLQQTAEAGKQETLRGGIKDLVYSDRAVLAGTSIAALWGVATLLGGVAYVVAGQSSFGSTRNLLVASGWLLFAGAAVAVGATGQAAWAAAVARRPRAAVELAAACASTLLFAIGLLAVAAAAPSGSSAGDIVTGVGLGGWLGVALYEALRRDLPPDGVPPDPVGGSLWRLASAGLLLLAVALGLPSAGVQQTALAVAEEVLFFAGLAVVAVTLSLARVSSSRRWLLVVGLALLSLSHLVASVAAGVIFGPSATLGGLRVAISVPAFIEAAGWAVVAATALVRFKDLQRATALLAMPGSDPPDSAWGTPVSPVVPEGAPPPGPPPTPPPLPGAEARPAPGQDHPY